MSRMVMGAIAVALVGLLLGAGCPLVPPQTAEVRVAHLSPDAPNVDVWVDGAVVLSDVPFETVSSYLSVPAGDRQIQVTPTGQTEPVVIDATVALAADTSSTVAATGLLNDDDLQPLVLADDRVPATGMAKVRFVHASPDAPAVDVALAGGAVLFADFAFREASEYLTVTPGTVDLEVRVAGTTNVALSVPGVTLGSDTNTTIFAIGLLADDTLAALPVVDTATDP